MSKKLLLAATVPAIFFLSTSLAAPSPGNQMINALVKSKWRALVFDVKPMGKSMSKGECEKMLAPYSDKSYLLSKLRSGKDQHERWYQIGPMNYLSLIHDKMDFNHNGQQVSANVNEAITYNYSNDFTVYGLVEIENMCSAKFTFIPEKAPEELKL